MELKMVSLVEIIRFTHLPGFNWQVPTDREQNETCGLYPWSGINKIKKMNYHSQQTK